MKNSFKHFLISLFSFIILSIILYFSFISLNEILDSPQIYFGPNVTKEIATEVVIYILLICTSVFLSYIIYLILGARTRAELVAEMRTISLYKSLNQLSKLYEESPLPYMTLNADGEILDPNKASLRFFGATPSEIERKNLFGFVAKDEIETAEKLLGFFRSHLPINREEIKFITKSGKERYALLSVFRMEGRHPGGKVGLATIVDITEEKELDKAKSEFVSLASHQLRTPAATIKWYSNMLLSQEFGRFNSKQQDYLERIYRVNENMVEIVDTLLNISRIESGTIEVDKKEIDVREMVDSILLELSSQITTKHLSITKDFGGSTNINADPKWLRIVAQNLISNSIKYTANMGTVSIKFRNMHGKTQLTVTDNGIGIPEKDKDKIFTKMFRAENAKVKSESQGTGLGLYLVKSILVAMGGSIDFVSEENKGSTFIATF